MPCSVHFLQLKGHPSGRVRAEEHARLSGLHVGHVLSPETWGKTLSPLPGNVYLLVHMSGLPVPPSSIHPPQLHEVRREDILRRRAWSVVPLQAWGRRSGVGLITGTASRVAGGDHQVVLPSFLVNFFLLPFVHFRGYLRVETQGSGLSLPYVSRSHLGMCQGLQLSH